MHKHGNIVTMLCRTIITASVLTALLCSCNTGKSYANNKNNSAGEYSLPSLDEEETMNTMNLGITIDAGDIAKSLKASGCSNPISPNVFCADPTAVEYNGRLYVYGTNDHQQYETVGDEGKNTYEKIRSIVVFSTNDMVNWIYHGSIDVGSIAPWVYASWAPSIVSRVENDGLTHFYLYFSNSGAGVGVITSTDPITGWTDPLGKPLIYGGMDGLNGCPTPFDPGVCIDDEGNGWLSFGAGITSDGSEYQTKATRIVRLGSDMLSLDSEIAMIPTYYAFEASELNYINGTYVYTYNTSWAPRDRWELEMDPPSNCSMAYMTTKTPLDPDSWEYKGHYFLNPGDSGMDYSNNHTHIHKYKDEWYILYHTLTLQERSDTNGGFRSLCVDKLPLNEKKMCIDLIGGTRQGVSQVCCIDPFTSHSGTEVFSSAKTWYEPMDSDRLSLISKASGAWSSVKGANFTLPPSAFIVKVKGKGRIEIRADEKDADAVAFIEFDCEEYSAISAEISNGINGIHDLYFIFSSEGISLDSWQFVR